MGLDLGKQYGPLPLGAWIAVVGVGLGIAYYTRGTATADPVTVEDGSSPPGVGDGSVGGWTPTSPGAGGPVGTVDISTNEAWGRAAINFLIANNYPPTTADSAIRKYLAGGTLSVSETALVSRALIEYGSPPTPLSPVESDPTTPPPDTTTPPIGKTVRVNVAAGFQWNQFVSWVRTRTPYDPRNKLDFFKVYALNPLLLLNVRGGKVVKATAVTIPDGRA